ncbi:sulfatase-like hydrolase/transferase [Rubritalea sp.]|uniref:sulfatase-like hydrolase/transferase n=1 Tax=Rubritalea sp. TaxID=2109375 RepID=UPI003EF17A78
MHKILSIVSAVSLAVIHSAHAAVALSSVGGADGYDLTGAEVAAFYTTSVAKSFDADGDDRYGTAGYLIFGGDSPEDNSADYGDSGVSVESLPSFVGSVTVDTGNTLVRKNTSQYAMDNPAEAVEGTDFELAGYLMNNGTSGTTDLPMLEFSVNTTDAVSFRLGVLAGNLDSQYDPSALRLSFDDSITGNADPSVNIASLPTVTSIGMVFFDITLDTGTTGTFTLAASESSSNPTIAGLTFDILPTAPSTIVYDFDDANGVVDSNNFGFGVTAGNWIFDVDAGDSAFQNDRAEAGVRTDGDSPTAYPVMRFDVTIPAGMSVDLDALSFDHGFNETAHVNDITPYWELSISTGSANVETNSLDSVNDADYFDQSESVSLSGLKGLTDTTVTFELTFKTSENRNNDLDRAHTIDNVVLTGSAFQLLIPPTIVNFSASPLVVDAGDTTTLSWEVADADSLVIDQGIGSVGLSGSTQVTVNADTTYTLTATNTDGDSSSELTVRLRPDTPNILVIVVDDMGVEDTSVNFNYDAAGNVLSPIDPTTVGLDSFSDDVGNAHFYTPWMEELASRGMVFSKAYAQQVCSPSRCSLMTGQNSARHGTIQWLGRKNDNLHNIQMPSNPGLQYSDRTLAEVFRDAGYRTIMSGKGHMGSKFTTSTSIYETPAASDDDCYYGFQINISANTGGAHGDCYSNDSTAFGLPASGATADFVAEYQDMTYNEFDPETYPSDHLVANEPLYVTEAITHELMERIESSVSDGEPFFAYFSQFALHAPHQTDPRYTANYPQFADNYNTLAYATMVEGMDKGLGDLMTKLEELGVAEDTLIIFTSDNGSDSRPRGPQNPATLTGTNPLRGEKGMRYEGGVRVPLIVSWAKRDTSNPFQQALPIAAGSREDDIVVIQDLYPTTLSMAGISVPDTDDDGDPLIIDGHDLSPYLRGESGNHRPQSLITHAPCSSRSSYFTTYHEDDWKLIYSYTTSSPVTSTNLPLGSYELYDLANDPYEAVNLSDDEPELVMTLARSMVAELERMGAPYPKLRSEDSSIAALGLPSASGDPHPVIMPELPAVDTDLDQLADNTEDPNRNGIQDAGETSSENANSDNDNVDDGDEVALGLDPLDPGSYFYLEATSAADGSLSITWPSQSGTSFEIRSSTDLQDWSTVVDADVPAAASGNSTTYLIPASAEAKEFYRIELK